MRHFIIAQEIYIISPLAPQPASAAGAEGAPGPSAAQPELRHHRHWQKVLQLVSGMQLSTLSTPLPANGKFSEHVFVNNFLKSYLSSQ